MIIRSHGELKSVLDALECQGVICVNATCPNVMRIQRLVAQAEQEGRQPVIIGEPHHPEVMGLASWCAHPLIFDGPDAVKMWLKNPETDREKPLTVVAQTTCIRELFETSWKILKKECTNVKIFDTICDATHKRQTEAAEIAGKVDVMVVVGDRKSANTKHLTEICMKRCPCVLQIENADELSADFFHDCFFVVVVILTFFCKKLFCQHDIFQCRILRKQIKRLKNHSKMKTFFSQFSFISACSQRRII